MIKAKNLNRLAIPAVLTLILCCVASAGPTYTFVKIAGEWAFFDEAEGLNSTSEAVEVKNSKPKRADNSEQTVNLPAIGSVMSLSGDSDDQVVSLLQGDSSGHSGVQSTSRTRPNNTGNNGAPLDPGVFQGGSISRTDGDDSSDHSSLAATLPNGKTRNTPNGNAWGWQKRNNEDPDEGDIAPVPVPVPGSIILAAIGAGLIKLLHDRRLKR